MEAKEACKQGSDHTDRFITAEGYNNGQKPERAQRPESREETPPPLSLLPPPDSAAASHWLIPPGSHGQRSLGNAVHGGQPPMAQSRVQKPGEAIGGNPWRSAGASPSGIRYRLASRGFGALLQDPWLSASTVGGAAGRLSPASGALTVHRKTWASVLPELSCVVLGRSRNLSEPRFPYP